MNSAVLNTAFPEKVNKEKLSEEIKLVSQNPGLKFYILQVQNKLMLSFKSLLLL